METILAAEIGPKSVSVVSAAIHDSNTFSLLKSRKWNLPDKPLKDPTPEEIDFYESQLTKLQLEIKKEYGDGHKTCLASFDGSSTLFTPLELPFSEKKKIEPVLPLQIQDVVPFDTDEFLFEPTVMQELGNNQYEVLVAYTNEKNVDFAINFLKGAGCDPKTLSPKASALVGIAFVLPKIFESNCVLISSSAVAVFINGNTAILRDLPEFHEPDELLTYVKGLIAETYQKTKTTVEQLYYAGSENVANYLSDNLDTAVQSLPLSHFVSAESDLEVESNQLDWAIGLLAREAKFLVGSKNKSLPSLNFRKGKYVYRAFFVDLVRNLKEQLLSITLFFGGLIFFTLATLLASTFLSGSYEDKLSSVLTEAFPGEEIELDEADSYSRNKVFDVQNQLMSLGSLENESPLSLIRDFTLALPPSFKLDISKFEIDLEKSGSAQIFGTLPSGIAQIGQLQEALRRPFGTNGKWCVKDKDFDYQSTRGVGSESKTSIRMKITRCEA